MPIEIHSVVQSVKEIGFGLQNNCKTSWDQCVMLNVSHINNIIFILKEKQKCRCDGQ